MSDATTWDERYATADRMFSGNPNAALVHEVDGLTPGTALDVGCGEGGDAVWLARQGWAVTAVDVSEVALRRVAVAADEAGVAVEVQRHDLQRSFPGGTFDLVSSQFLYSYGDFPRERILRRAADAVAPGGILLIESHQGHGPGEEHPPIVFPSPAELLAGLDLAPGEWEVLRCAEHPSAGDRTDSTVKLRRAAR
ncbi:methyltransferase domain-containing protein [Couchioplanes caeruleus]|uniref:class I SAM-dependent methyltransferase n=1 Tax=Couchioplanes caeruleus TaxID=56438 RepID=UPI0020BE89E5|nr:class I SAM-dependent methyltransferase [Couchioplanes caeruleus]UQU61599.1 methyltransferase domain-containing protein [Couchioplanes caeruleus]